MTDIPIVGKETGRETNPFEIHVVENKAMGCFDLLLQVGGLTESQGKGLADAISEWITDAGKIGYAVATEKTRMQ